VSRQENGKVGIKIDLGEIQCEDALMELAGNIFSGGQFLW
jgi:hypothetical protein